MTNKSEEKIPKAYCRTCKQNTQHKTLNYVMKSDYDDNVDEGMYYEYYTLQCLGCESVCLLLKSTYSGDMNYQTGDYDSTYHTYPDPFENKDPISNHYSIPEPVHTIYLETVRSFNKKTPILTSIGI